MPKTLWAHSSGQGSLSSLRHCRKLFSPLPSPGLSLVPPSPAQTPIPASAWTNCAFSSSPLQEIKFFFVARLLKQFCTARLETAIWIILINPASHILLFYTEQRAKGMGFILVLEWALLGLFWLLGNWMFRLKNPSVVSSTASLKAQTLEINSVISCDCTSCLMTPETEQGILQLGVSTLKQNVFRIITEYYGSYRDSVKIQKSQHFGCKTNQWWTVKVPLHELPFLPFRGEWEGINHHFSI